MRSLAALLLACGFVTPGCEPPLPTVDLSEPAPGSPAEGDPPPVEPTLRIAVGPLLSPELTRSVDADLLRKIAERLDERAMLIQRRTYSEIAAVLGRGEADLGFVSTVAYLEGKERYGLQLLVSPVVRGERVAETYLMVSASSGASSLEDLRGRRFASNDPLSYAGAILPRHILTQRGESPETFFLETIFTGAHDTSVRAVASGMADGTAVHSWAYEVLRRTEPGLLESVRVVGESEPFAMEPVVVPPTLSAERVEQLRSCLLTLHEDPSARPALERSGIDRFEVTTDEDYDDVRVIWDSLRDGAEG